MLLVLNTPRYLWPLSDRRACGGVFFQPIHPWIRHGPLLMEPADSCPRLARLAAAELASTHLTLQSPQTAAAASAATHLTLPSPQAAAVEPAATHLTLQSPQTAAAASAATHLTLPSPQAAAVEPAATHLTLPPPQAAVGARLERAGVQVEPAGSRQRGMVYSGGVAAGGNSGGAASIAGGGGGNGGSGGIGGAVSFVSVPAAEPEAARESNSTPGTAEMACWTPARDAMTAIPTTATGAIAYVSSMPIGCAQFQGSLASI